MFATHSHIPGDVCVRLRRPISRTSISSRISIRELTSMRGLTTRPATVKKTTLGYRAPKQEAGERHKLSTFLCFTPSDGGYDVQPLQYLQTSSARAAIG